jgi:hypothetical protein
MIKHRNEAGFEEQVKQHEVEGAEHADHEAFQDEKRDHVFAHAVFDRFPGGKDTDRHQKRGQDHEQHRNAVDAHLVFDGPEPSPRFDELERRTAGIKVDPDQQRGGKRQQRDP